MPQRQVVAKELANMFKVMGHPDRIRVIEELGNGEKDVNSLVDILGLPGPRVSQHLGLMRSNRIVVERCEGRHRFYRLIQPEVASWIVDGLRFIEGFNSGPSQSVIGTARDLWTSPVIDTTK